MSQPRPEFTYEENPLDRKVDIAPHFATEYGPGLDGETDTLGDGVIHRDRPTAAHGEPAAGDESARIGRNVVF